MSDEKDIILSFKIHSNFKNRGLILGIVKFKNLMEAIGMCSSLALIIFLLIKDLRIMIIAQVLIVGPLFIVGLTGVNGNSFFEFLKLYFSFSKRKKYNIMRYKRIEKRKKTEKNSKKKKKGR